MKKFNAILVLLGLSLGLFAQGPFTGVNWVNYKNNFPGLDLATAATPYEKASVAALKTSDNFAVTVADLDEITLPAIWDRLGEEAVIAKNTKLPEGGTDPMGDDFKLAFKTFYDDANLYVVFKWTDASSVSAVDSRLFEIALQTKEYDRYEAGLAALTATPLDTAKRNAQYCRFSELGGFKAKFDKTGVVESVGTKGQTGAWGGSLNSANTFETNYNVDGTNTLWAVIAFNYADHMMYMTNEWGLYEAANYTTFDPAAKPKIAFEVKGVSKDGAAADYEWWWNGNENNSYTVVWFNGYLEFSDDFWYAVATDNHMINADQSAYIHNDVLRFKGIDRPVNVELYSVIGQRVRSAQNISELNVSDLRDGIYLVKVDGIEKAFKVLK